MIDVEFKTALCLDVPTKWNSTYLMLKSAIVFDKTFEKYEENDSSFRSDLGDDIPDYSDWQCAKNLIQLLKQFYKMTLRISGSQYVTTNTFFSEIADLFCTLTNWIKYNDMYMRSIGLSMKTKFNKY